MTIGKAAVRRIAGDSKRTGRVLYLCSMSKLVLTCYPSPRLLSELQHVRIDIGGLLAKLPSVTNNRLAMIPKAGLQKTLDMALAEHDSTRRAALLRRALEELADLRAVHTKNPAHSEQLEGLTLLYERAVAGYSLRPCFDDDNDSRVFVLMLLGRCCGAFDSHNLLKGPLDWLQKIGLVRNDRNLDALALRKSEFGVISDRTSIILMRSHHAQPLLARICEELATWKP